MSRFNTVFLELIKSQVSVFDVIAEAKLRVVSRADTKILDN